jgi:hypothetical protein
MWKFTTYGGWTDDDGRTDHDGRQVIAKVHMIFDQVRKKACGHMIRCKHIYVFDININKYIYK